MEIALDKCRVTFILSESKNKADESELTLLGIKLQKVGYQIATD